MPLKLKTIKNSLVTIATADYYRPLLAEIGLVDHVRVVVKNLVQAERVIYHILCNVNGQVDEYRAIILVIAIHNGNKYYM